MSKESEPRTSTTCRRRLGKAVHQANPYGLGGLFSQARHNRYDEAAGIVNRAPVRGQPAQEE